MRKTRPSAGAPVLTPVRGKLDGGRAGQLALVKGARVAGRRQRLALHLVLLLLGLLRLRLWRQRWGVRLLHVRVPVAGVLGGRSAGGGGRLGLGAVL